MKHVWIVSTEIRVLNHEVFAMIAACKSKKKALKFVPDYTEPKQEHPAIHAFKFSGIDPGGRKHSTKVERWEIH